MRALDDEILVEYGVFGLMDLEVDECPRPWPQGTMEPGNAVEAIQNRVDIASAQADGTSPDSSVCGGSRSQGRSLEELLDEARREDAAHRDAHQRPISAENLRTRLGTGSLPARRLIKIVRAEVQARRALTSGVSEFDRAPNADPVPVV